MAAANARRAVEQEKLHTWCARVGIESASDLAFWFTSYDQALHEAIWLNALGMSKWSGAVCRIPLCPCPFFSYNFCLSIMAAVCIKPMRVTLRSNGKSLRLITFAVQELDLFGLLHIILSFHSTIVIGLTFSILLTIFKESTRYR